MRRGRGRRPLRIGFDGRFLQDKFDGVGRYAYGLLSGLREAPGDHEVAVFRDPRLPNSRFDLEALAEGGRIRFHEFRVPLYSPLELVAWPLAARRARIDVLHSPYFWSPVNAGRPLVATVHDMIFDRHPEYIPGRRYLLPYWVASRLMIRRADAIVAVSEATAADVVRYSGAGRRDRISVIPNGVEDRFRPVESRAQLDALRRRLGLPGRFLLALGARRPHKNVERLVAAFERIADRVPHTLVLAGAVDLRFGSQSAPALERLRAAGRLVETGRVPEEDLPALYSCADLFVQPSIIEGFGLPLLEAMACGTAVACSDTSSLPEVAGDAGALFSPYSEESIAATLLSVLSGAARRRDMAARGQERAARFRWPAIARATAEVYRAAAEGSAVARGAKEAA